MLHGNREREREKEREREREREIPSVAFKHFSVSNIKALIVAPNSSTFRVGTFRIAGEKFVKLNCFLLLRLIVQENMLHF